MGSINWLQLPRFYLCSPSLRMDTSHTTKSCVLILLVALLCAERAQGLQCYECYGVPIETSCPAVTCRASDGFCIAQNIELIEDSQRRKLKTRQCLSFCPAGVPIRDPNIRERTSCCSEDLCNAAVPTAGSTWTMAGVLLFSLSSVVLQTLL